MPTPKHPNPPWTRFIWAVLWAQASTQSTTTSGAQQVSRRTGAHGAARFALELIQRNFYILKCWDFSEVLLAIHGLSPHTLEFNEHLKIITRNLGKIKLLETTYPTITQSSPPWLDGCSFSHMQSSDPHIYIFLAEGPWSPLTLLKHPPWLPWAEQGANTQRPTIHLHSQKAAGNIE